MDRQNCGARVRIWFEASEQKTYKRFKIPNFGVQTVLGWRNEISDLKEKDCTH